MPDLTGKTVAILAADGFEESELFRPRQAIVDAGGSPKIVSVTSGSIEANRHRQAGEKIGVDETLESAAAKNYDALVIPGGLFSPDALRVNEKALAFVRDFFEQAKPVAAICHGPQVLIDAGVVKGREMTSVENIRTDLENAGARVRDAEVVTDRRLVTSRTPDDLDAFNAALLEEIVKGEAKAA